MKKLLMLALFIIFIFNSCTKNSSNPVNVDTIPSAPVLSSPIDASSGIAIVAALSWRSTSGAASYSIQVSANSSFSVLVFSQSGFTDTTKQIIGLNPLSIYYWRVSAANTAGTSA